MHGARNCYNQYRCAEAFLTSPPPPTVGSVICGSLSNHKWFKCESLYFNYQSLMWLLCASFHPYCVSSDQHSVSMYVTLWLNGLSSYTNCQSMKWLWCASIYMSCMTQTHQFYLKGNHRWSPNGIQDFHPSMFTTCTKPHVNPAKFNNLTSNDLWWPPIDLQVRRILRCDTS